MFKKIILFASFAFINYNLFSQTYSIENYEGAGNSNSPTTVTTCSGTFQDAGGQYSNNEDIWVTFCSGSTALMNFDFSTLSLESGWDFLEVYDGPNGNSPLLDNITGNVGAYILQSSGSCLTFHFTTDGSGTAAGFSAAISCVTPCVPPTAGGAVTNFSSPVKVCLNDVINFSAASSSAGPGFNITNYDWNFDDGSTGTGVTTSHSYSTPGEYIVQVEVTDNNNCTNNNLIDLVVQVGTEPNFVGTTPNQTVCAGQNVCLDGVVNPTPWQDIPSTTVAGVTPLPDGSGICYTAPLTFTQFIPGSTITNGNQVDDVFANLEHTWAGDLSITLQCPNGQEVGLFNGDQTWNTTNISSENFGDPGAGVGYDYTWVNSGSTIDDWGAANPGATTGTSIPSGTYASEDNFSNLVGCPLNGTWQLLICDWFSSDDGTVFSWGMNFDPSLYAGLGGFTPVFASNSTGTTWSGNNAASNGAITSISNDGNQVCVTPPAAGTYSYTFTGTDDFGCSYDTVITITATAGAIANAGNDISYCSGGSGTIGAAPQSGVTYSWSPTTGLSSGSASNPTVTLTNNTSSPVTTTFILTTSASGCTDTDTVNVTVNPQPVANFTQPAAQCLTGNSFSFNNTSTNATNYSWDFGDGNTSTAEDPTHSYASVGTYTVTLTASNGACTDDVSFDITVNPMPVPTAIADSVLCNGGSTGSVSVTGVTGTSTFPGGYGYSWDDNSPPSAPISTSQTVTGLGVGTYTVTVTDLSTTCQAQTTVIIYEPTPLTVGETHVNPLCAGGTDGTATANPSGGTPGYSYSWNTTPIQTTQTATGLAAGTYQCTVTDVNNCTEIVNVTILDGSVITAGFNLPADQCLTGNSFTFTNTGTSGATYDWNFGDGSGTSTSESPTYSYGTDGTFTVTQIVSAGTCADTITQVVTVNPMPIPFATADSVLCNGQTTGTAQVDSITNSAGPYDYSWTSGSTNFNATGLAAGNYTVTVTDQNTSCSAQTTVTVSEPPLLTVSGSKNDPICNGDPTGDATATASGGTAPYTYLWNTVPAQTTPTASNLIAGTYQCTVTDYNGCTQTTSLTLIDPAGIVLTTSSTLANCGQPDGSATVNVASGGSGSFSYSWATTPSQSTATATNILAGTYTVTVTDDVTNCTVDTTVTVPSTSAINVTANFLQNALCFGSEDGLAYATVAGGTAPYSYSWNSNPAQTNDTLVAGIGNYTVTVTDSNGCTGSDAVAISEPIPVTATISSSTDVSCFGLTDGTATASGSGGTGGTYTYSWNTTPIQNSQTASNLDDGTYTVIVSDSNSCSDTTQVVINDGIIVTADFVVPADQCLTGNSFTFTNLGTTGGGTTFDWDFGDAAGTSTSESPTYSYADSGTYNVTQIVYSGVCSDTNTYSVTVNPMPVPVATADSVNCNGGTDGSVTVVNVTGTSAFPAGYDYSWNSSPIQTTQTATGLGIGNYTVIVTDQTTNCTGQTTVTVYEPTPVIASITASTDETCLGANDGTATASGSQGTGGYTYSWNTTPAQSTQTATGLAPGTYTVYVYDDNLCVDSVDVTINPGPELTASSTGTNITCFGLTNGSIDLTIGNAPGPVTYSWAPGGSTSEDPVGLAAGTYIVTATSLGCSVNDTITLTQPDELVAAIDSSYDAFCNGSSNGGAFGSATGGTLPYTFSWNTPIPQTSVSVSNLAAGNYTLTVTDSNNCQSIIPVVINEPAPLDASLGSLNAYCGLDQGTVFAQPLNGTAPYSYAWDSSGVAIGTTDTVNGLYPGSYHLSITDANGCKYLGDVDVVADPAGIASLSGQTDVSCFGGADGTATISVSGAIPPFSYQWDNAAGNQTTNPATGLSAGIFYVSVTDSVGCVMNTFVDIKEPTELTLSFDVLDKICPDSCNAIVTGLPSGGVSPYNYTWNDPATQISQSATGLCSGYITLVVEDNKGCTITDSVLITNPPKMELSSTYTPASCNQADGSATVSVLANGTPPFYYEWSTDGVTVIDTNSSISNVVAGTYYANVFDSLGCNVYDTIVIPNLSAPQIDSSTTSNVLCFGGNTGSAEVFVSGGGFPYTYSWDDPNNQTSPAATNLTAGSYIVTVTDTNGCEINGVVNITEPTELMLTTGGTDPSCTGYSDGFTWVNALGGTMPYNYSWNDLIMQQNDTASNLNSGTYTVTVTDSNGCFKTENVQLIDPALFTIDVTGVDVSCNGGNDGSATVALNNGNAPFSYSWNDPLNQSTSTALSLNANTYNVTVTDSSGCIANGSIVINEPELLQLSLDSTGNVSCNGLSDGFATTNVTGGSGTYTFDWSLNGTSVSNLQSPSGLAAGLYTVTVTDTAGCSDQITVNISEPSPLVANAITSDAKCFNQNSGYAYAVVNGGTTPYTYLWDDLNLQQTDTAFNLLAGTYNLTVTDSNGCQDIVNNITIDQPTQIVLNVSTQSSTCGDANGSASVTAAGGTSPYNFNWSTSPTQSNAVAINLLAGSYTVIVTDLNGCKDSISANVVDFGSPTVSIPTTTNVSCNGASDGTATALAVGGTAPYSYLWSNGDTTALATGLAGQNYSVTVTDSNGCIASNSVLIQEASGLTAVINTSTNVSCFGGSDGSATAIAAGGNGTNYNFSWNTIPVQNTQSVTGLSQGDYIVTVSDSNNCLAFDTITITEPALLTMTLDSIKNVNCFNGNDGYINLIAGGGTQPYTSYSWSPSVSTGATGSGLSAGTYTITITDNKNCTVTDSFTITQPQILAITTDSTSSTCGSFNGSAEVTSTTGGTSPYSYNWNDPNNQQTPLANGLVANTYTVIVSDANGCSVTQDVTVNDNPGPIVDSVSVIDPLCNGDLNGSAQVYASGNGPFTYSWTPSGQVSDVASNLGAGVYSVFVTDVNQCSVSFGGIIVNEPPVLTANITMPPSACYGQEIQLFGVGGGGTPFAAPQDPYDVIWLAPFNTTGTGPFYDTVETNFTYNIVVQDANGCVETHNETIQVGAPLNISATGDEICLGETAVVNASATGGLLGADYEYTWLAYDSLTGNTITPAGVSNPTSSTSVNVNPTDTTDYIVIVSDGCSQNDTTGLTVIVNDTAIVSFTATNDGCPYPFWSVGFEVNGDQWNSTFYWDFDGDGVTDLASQNDSVSYDYYNSGLYDIGLTVVTENGCSSSFIRYDEVEVYTIPQANFVFSPEDATMLDPTIDFSDLSSNGVVNWYWDFGDFTTDFINQNPSHTYQDTGFYLVTLAVENQSGCADTVDTYVQIRPDFFFAIPNTFTPSGDGLNEIFMPGSLVGVSEDDYTFLIFDRWGEKIYEGHDLDDGWDGTVRGSSEPVQTGVYVWKIKLKGIDGVYRDYIGHVNLLK